MAKTTKSNSLKDLENNPVIETKKSTIKKVKFIEMVRADFGAFDAGDVAEIDADIAKTLKMYGYCEDFNGEVAKEENEEY